MSIEVSVLGGSTIDVDIDIDIAVDIVSMSLHASVVQCHAVLAGLEMVDKLVHATKAVTDKATRTSVQRTQVHLGSGMHLAHVTVAVTLVLELPGAVRTRCNWPRCRIRPALEPGTN